MRPVMSTEIHIELNGEAKTVPAGTTLAALLAAVPHPRVFALELDGAIIPSADFAATALHDHSRTQIGRLADRGQDDVHCLAKTALLIRSSGNPLHQAQLLD